MINPYLIIQINKMKILKKFKMLHLMLWNFNKIMKIIMMMKLEFHVSFALNKSHLACIKIIIVILFIILKMTLLIMMHNNNSNKPNNHKKIKQIINRIKTRINKMRMINNQKFLELIKTNSLIIIMMFIIIIQMLLNQIKPQLQMFQIMIYQNLMICNILNM